MKEKLIIKNFGPIKEVSFDFKNINILIGEQGTGKSTVAKLIAAINRLASGEPILSSQRMMREDENGKLGQLKDYLKVYEIDSYIKNSTQINYQHSLFTFDFLNNDWSITAEKASGQDVNLGWLKTTFIPADRAAVNLLSNELLYTLNEISQDLPGYFVNFGQLFNRLKKQLKSFDFSDTLGVIYRYEKNQDKIQIADNKEISISEASSAIQTNIPMLVVLNSQLMIEPYQGFASPLLNVSIIEEPELNCFPLLQNSILKYMVLCVHPAEDAYARRTIITTHSPYILTSLNNLMYAFQVGQEHSEEVNKIIDKKYWVNPKDVSVYKMLTDGSCEDIMDKELNQIKVEKIDGISEALNEDWHKMANLEYEASK